MAKTVMCRKLKQELPALERPVWPGELGQKIQAEISSDAWDLWKQHATMLINEYRLNLRDLEAQTFMRQQMQAFLFDSGGGVSIEQYVPPKE